MPTPNGFFYPDWKQGVNKLVSTPLFLIRDQLNKAGSGCKSLNIKIPCIS